ATAATVRALVRDLFAQENHVVAAMGISDGATDFRAVFREMGIPDRWILTPGNSASEIRKAFQVFSRSAVAASQGGALANLGGFANQSRVLMSGMSRWTGVGLSPGCVAPACGGGDDAAPEDAARHDAAAHDAAVADAAVPDAAVADAAVPDAAAPDAAVPHAA